MQSNETEREVFVWPDIFRAIGPGDDMVVSAEKLQEWLDEREHHKTLQARIQGAEMLADMVNAAVIDGKQSHSVSVIQKIVNRELAELQSQLTKKERAE